MKGPLPIGLGVIPVEPNLVGTWPFADFPEVVELTLADGTTRTFVQATWAWPLYSGVVPGGQYREAVDANAMHLMVYRDGSFTITHLDEANPDRGHVLEHALVDAGLETTLACGALGLALGLVVGLWVLE